MVRGLVSEYKENVRIKMRIYTPKILLCFLLCSNYFGVAYAMDEWICTEAASIRQGDSILSCGVAMDVTESAAREAALQNAISEFDMLCELSANCRGRDTNVDPIRNSCEKVKGGYKCYRGVQYTLLGEVQSDGSNRSTIYPVNPGFSNIKKKEQRQLEIGVGPSVLVMNYPMFSYAGEDLIQEGYLNLAGGTESYTGYSMSISYFPFKNLGFKLGYYRVSGSGEFKKNRYRTFLENVSSNYDSDEDFKLNASEYKISGIETQVLVGSDFYAKGFNYHLGIGLYSVHEEYYIVGLGGRVSEPENLQALLGVGYSWGDFRINLNTKMLALPELQRPFRETTAFNASIDFSYGISF